MPSNRTSKSSLPFSHRVITSIEIFFNKDISSSGNETAAGFGFSIGAFQWIFGTDLCGWMLVGSRVQGDSRNAKHPRIQASILWCSLFFKSTAASIHDCWKTLGELQMDFVGKMCAVLAITMQLFLEAKHLFAKRGRRLRQAPWVSLFPLCTIWWTGYHDARFLRWSFKPELSLFRFHRKGSSSLSAPKMVSSACIWGYWLFLRLG